VGPWIASSLFGIARDKDLGAVCGAVYIAGSAWNIFLPIVIKWLKRQSERVLGSDEKA
jgi:hypothetical protein